MSSVFLSYARSDDEPFARALYNLLDTKGFDVWFDREAMPSRSLSFLQEIRDAIRARDRLLVVLGPSAIASEYVRAEWQAALVDGVAVTPVLRLGEYDLVPPELANLHCPDVRLSRDQTEARNEVLRVLSESVPPVGPLIGAVPEVPPRFQPRPNDLSRLARALLYEVDNPVVLPPIERVTLLQGMGGVGKSVLAAAMARSISTRRVFGDGVLWVELTPSTTPLEIVRDVVAAAGLAGGRPSGLADGVSRIRSWLADRRALLVLDNAWAMDQVAPLINALSPVCRLLVTTRDAALGHGLGATTLTLDVLHPSAAVVHLADWVGKAPEDLPDTAREVAVQCGGLPFALALQGALARGGTPWSDLLEALTDADLAFARQAFPNYPYPDVLATLQVSVDALAKEDPDAVARFGELGAFFWLGGVSEPAVLALWESRAQLRGRHGRRLLQRLEDKALIRRSVDPPVVRVHDLVADYLRAKFDVPEMRAAMLDGYRSRCERDWPDGADDGYFHRHLLDHLAELDDGPAEIDRVLRLTTPDGDPAWFRASDRTGHLDAYRAQLERRIRSSDTALTAVMRLVLCTASVGAQAAHVSPTMVRALVEAGVWTAPQAFGYVYQVGEPAQRALGLVTLRPLMPPSRADELLDKALAVARLLEKVPTSLIPLIEALVAAERTDSALALARRSGPGDERTRALAAVAAAVEGRDRATVLTEALSACADTHPLFRSAALEPILPLLDVAGVEGAMDAVVTTIEHPMPRGWCTSAMVGRLVALGAADRAIELAQTIQDGTSHGEALVHCLPLLGPTQRQDAVIEVLEIVTSFDEDPWIETAKVAFADLPPMLSSTLPIILSAWPVRLELLTSLVPYLDAASGRKALKLIRADPDVQFRAEASLALAERLDDDEGRDLLAALWPEAWAIEDAETRMKALGALLGLAESEPRRELGARVWNAVSKYRPIERRQAIEALASRLDADEIVRAIDLAVTLPETSDRLEAISALAEHADGQGLKRAQAATMAIGDDDAVLLSLCSLAEGLTPPERRELLNEAAKALNGYLRARALALLAPHLEQTDAPVADTVLAGLEDPTALAQIALPALARAASGDRRRRFLDRAIDVAAAMSDPERRVWALDAFVDLLDPVATARAKVQFDSGLATVDEGWRAFAGALSSACFAAHLPGAEGAAAWQHSVALLPALEDADLRRDVLSRLAGSPDLEKWKVLVALATEEPDVYERGITTGWLIQRCPPVFRPILVQAVWSNISQIQATEFSDEGERLEGAIARLLPYHDNLDGAMDLMARMGSPNWQAAAIREAAESLPKERLDDVLDLARKLSDPDSRARAIAALAGRWPENRRPILVAEAVDAAWQAKPYLHHDRLLPELSDLLCALSGPDLLALWRAKAPELVDESRPQLLARLHGLAPVLVKLELAGPTARAIRDVSGWWP